MSRQIKFRAWDQKDKKYLLPEKQGFVILPTMPSFGVTLPYENCSNPGNIDEDCIDWADADLLMGRYELEQYTGIKDTNGKEIYEGDIVTLCGEWEDIENDDCQVVTFSDGCFRVGDGYENEVGGYLQDWRVIGNIHENPELLEGENV